VRGELCALHSGGASEVFMAAIPLPRVQDGIGECEGDEEKDSSELYGCFTRVVGVEGWVMVRE